MIYYTIYKVTNKINGKIYIGSHKTNNLNDEYMGSGTYLKNAISKHGLENFEKEILYIFDTPELMYAKEAEIVNEDFITDNNTYNLKKGGFGGFGYINSTGKNLYGMNGKTPNIKDNLSRGRQTQKTRKENDPEYAEKIRKKLSAALKGRPGTFNGKTHTDNTKKIIGMKSSKHQHGEGNSQYGTRWIYSLEERTSKKISKDAELPQGWLEGRKLKF